MISSLKDYLSPVVKMLATLKDKKDEKKVGINKNTIPMLEAIKIDGYAMIRPILAQENIIDSTKKLKRLIYNNKKSLDV